jgi:DNA repair ATPase RecN
MKANLVLSLVEKSEVQDANINVLKCVTDVELLHSKIGFLYYEYRSAELEEAKRSAEEALSNFVKQSEDFIKSHSEKEYLDERAVRQDKINEFESQMKKLEEISEGYINIPAEQKQQYRADHTALAHLLCAYVPKNLSWEQHYTNLYKHMVDYYNQYNHMETWSKERKESVTALKTEMKEMLEFYFQHGKDELGYKPNSIKVQDKLLHNILSNLFNDYKLDTKSGNVEARMRRDKTIFVQILKGYISYNQYKAAPVLDKTGKPKDWVMPELDAE